MKRFIYVLAAVVVIVLFTGCELEPDDFSETDLYGLPGTNEVSSGLE